MTPIDPFDLKRVLHHEQLPFLDRAPRSRTDINPPILESERSEKANPDKLPDSYRTFQSTLGTRLTFDGRPQNPPHQDYTFLAQSSDRHRHRQVWEPTFGTKPMTDEERKTTSMFLGGEYGRGDPSRVNPGINTFYDKVNEEEAERQARIRKELALVSTTSYNKPKPSRAEIEAEKQNSAPHGPQFPFDRPTFHHAHTVPLTNAIVNTQYAQNKLDLMKRRAEYAKMIEEQLKERNEKEESAARVHQQEIKQALESDYWNKPQPVIVTRRDRGNPTLRFDPITHNLQPPAPTNHRREHPSYEPKPETYQSTDGGNNNTGFFSYFGTNGRQADVSRYPLVRTDIGLNAAGIQSNLADNKYSETAEPNSFDSYFGRPGAGAPMKRDDGKIDARLAGARLTHLEKLRPGELSTRFT